MAMRDHDIIQKFCSVKRQKSEEKSSTSASNEQTAVSDNRIDILNPNVATKDTKIDLLSKFSHENQKNDEKMEIEKAPP